MSILNSAHSSSNPEGLIVVADSKVFNLSPLNLSESTTMLGGAFCNSFLRNLFFIPTSAAPVMRGMTDGSVRTFSTVFRNVHGVHLISVQDW